VQTKVIKTYCHYDFDGKLEFEELIRLKHNYWNAQAAAYKKLYEEKKERFKFLCPQLVDLANAIETVDKEIEETYKIIKKKNSDQRERKASDELVQKVKSLKLEKSKLCEQHKKVTQSFFDTIVPDRKKLQSEKKELKKKYGRNGWKTIPRWTEINKLLSALESPFSDLKNECKAAIKEARKPLDKNGVSAWGCWEVVDEAIQKSLESSPTGPKFKSWNKLRGEGSINVRLQGYKQEDGTRQRVTLDEIKSGYLPFITLENDEKRKGNWKLTLRVANGGKNAEPIWFTLSIHKDRRFVAGTEILQINLQRRLIGRKFDYFVHWVVKLPETKHEKSSKKISVDLGFRPLKEGLRILGGHCDDAADLKPFLFSKNKLVRESIIVEGNKLQLFLPWSLVRRINYIENSKSPKGLKKIRSDEFNKFRTRFLEMLSRDKIPEFLAESISYLHLIRSPQRFAKLIGEWKESYRDLRGKISVPKNEQKLFKVAWKWHLIEYHLHDFQVGVRKRFDNQRDQLYRSVGVSFSYFEKVLWDDLDLSEMHKNPDPENKAKNAALKYIRHAALSKLRNYVEQQCRGSFELVNPAYTTKHCPKCDHINNWSVGDGKQQILICQKCKFSGDRDLDWGAVNVGRAAEWQPKVLSRSQPKARKTLGSKSKKNLIKV